VLVGAISALRVDANGGVTGTMRVKGVSAPIRGTFTAAGRLLSTPGSVPSFDLRLERTAPPSSGEVLRGTVILNRTKATADLPKAAFSAGLTVPPALASAGPYTMLLPSAPGSGSSIPGGDGWATATLSTAGVLTVSATLGDGTKFTETAYLSADGQASLYADLYPQTRPRE